tara:strand:- start:14312 stop:15145 length:834 start_codon:yes stop_codon:yes gene_type:complete
MARRKLTEEEKKARAEKRAKNKEEKLRLAEEERKASVLRQRFESISFYPKTEPKYTFSVGDIVDQRTGFKSKIKILEVLDSGRIYLGGDDKEKNYYHWTHLQDKKCKVSEKVLRKESVYQQISFHNTILESLIFNYYSFGIDMSPSYQRDLVWTDEDKESLLDSIFNSIEIGKFVLIELPFKEKSPGYEILDGKQRLSTLIEFYEDRFKYKGLSFSELSNRDKSHFMDFSITLGKSEGIPLKDKIEYFLQLNQTGKPQDPKHIEVLQKEIEKINKQK